MLHSSYNNKFQVSKIKLQFNIRPHSWRSRVLCTCSFTIHHVDIPDRFYQRTWKLKRYLWGKASGRLEPGPLTTYPFTQKYCYSDFIYRKHPSLHTQVVHTQPWGPAKQRAEILWELETLCISPERRDTTSLAMCVNDFQISSEFLLSNSDYEPCGK